MIIGKCFEGDDDEKLKMYQHSCYYDSLSHWIIFAGKLSLQYSRLPRWEELSGHWEKFRTDGQYDHRCIQAHHDLIAQQFRIRLKTPELYFWVVRSNYAWPDFFHNEVSRFMKDAVMLRLFMTVLAYANTRPGYDAEDELLDKMREKYGMEKLSHPVIEQNAI